MLGNLLLQRNFRHENPEIRFQDFPGYLAWSLKSEFQGAEGMLEFSLSGSLLGNLVLQRNFRHGNPEIRFQGFQGTWHGA